jgi:hypothetical protein
LLRNKAGNVPRAEEIITDRDGKTFGKPWWREMAEGNAELNSYADKNERKAKES